jgi:hypothetical protein
MSPRRVLLSIGVACLLVGALAGFLYGVDSTPTRISTSISTTRVTVPVVPDAFGQVASSYTNHLLLLDSKNASALTAGYESNATVEWKGYSGGCDGNYTGLEDVDGLLGTLVRANYLLVSNETQNIMAEGSHWVVTSEFAFGGNGSASGPFEGNFQGTISAQDSYVHVGSVWLIASETWDFTYFVSSFIEQGGFPPEC